jgi:putative hemolysin
LVRVHIKFLAASTSFFNKIIGLKPRKDTISEMELRTLLKAATKEGVIENEESIILEQVFYFSDKRAKHIMTHRTDVEWVDISKSKEEVIRDLLNCKHSKVLACNGKLDDFVGIISIKELLVELYRNKDFSIDDLIQEPLIFPSTLRAQKVLEMFRNNHKSIGVVVDEYGSVDGIITLHDIMETLVGPIADDDKSEEPDIFMQSENRALVNGEAPVELLTLLIDDFILDFETIDYSTIAGFVLANINKIPQVGDKFIYNGVTFEIVEVDGNKIGKVLITKNKKPTNKE